ncbi:hypothetical protein CFOL_v3_12217 [Cephalotus follicularis]|uniref:Uncharacterized protein n=1 Tax=Cephalotus follicularis TaxID=3775 RepID=A0A1Q3BLI0_CEPFO|nr:hypothetical protein CFOL_v3_12217 [Cephalotus follicularis]
MTTLINHSLLLSPNLKCYFFTSFCIKSPTYPNILQRHRPLILKCSNNPEERENNISSSINLKDALSGMVDKQVEELLNKEENRVLLDGLEKASQRVEMAKKELAEIERQELEAKQMKGYINHLESKAFEIAECQQEISEARALVEEAKSSLSLNSDAFENGYALIGNRSEEIDKNEERWESIRAASISALVGTLAGLPISLTQATTNFELILPLAINFISCALFGVTFRYTIRRDLDNFQLKTGTSAAFGFVKGLATMAGGLPLEPTAGSLWSHTYDGAVYVSENLLVFLFAAIGLDFCFKIRLLSPFPIKLSAPKD